MSKISSKERKRDEKDRIKRTSGKTDSDRIYRNWMKVEVREDRECVRRREDNNREIKMREKWKTERAKQKK